MSDSNPILTQFALDWHRITAEWVKHLEAEMDEAFRADDTRRYRFAAHLRGQIATARQVMLDSAHMGSSSKSGGSGGEAR